MREFDSRYPLHLRAFRRRSQVVRQEPAKPPFPSSNLGVASKFTEEPGSRLLYSFVMRFAVVGAGAIGGFVAAMLARAGVDVGVVARGHHFAAIGLKGLHVISEVDEFTVSITASDDLRKLGRTFDVIILAVKAHQLAELIPQLLPAAEAGAQFVTLQNGIPFWYFQDRTLSSVDPGGTISQTVPASQIVGGVVYASGRIVAPGVIEQSGGMRYVLGEPAGTRSPRVLQISSAFSAAGLQAPVVDDIRKEVWNKLLGNASLNPVSVLTRKTVLKMLDDPPTRQLIESLMAEVLDVAQAVGVDVGITVEERVAAARKIADVKTSMLQDFEAHRKMELDPIVGAVVELAAKFRVAAPNLAKVYAQCKALQPKEAHARQTHRPLS